MFKATKNTNYFVQQNAIKVDMDFKGFNWSARAYAASYETVVI